MIHTIVFHRGHLSTVKSLRMWFIKATQLTVVQVSTELTSSQSKGSIKAFKFFSQILMFQFKIYQMWTFVTDLHT